MKYVMTNIWELTIGHQEQQWVHFKSNFYKCISNSNKCAQITLLPFYFMYLLSYTPLYIAEHINVLEQLNYHREFKINEQVYNSILLMRCFPFNFVISCRYIFRVAPKSNITLAFGIIHTSYMTLLYTLQYLIKIKWKAYVETLMVDVMMTYCMEKQIFKDTGGIFSIFYQINIFVNISMMLNSRNTKWAAHSHRCRSNRWRGALDCLYMSKIIIV